LTSPFPTAGTSRAAGNPKAASYATGPRGRQRSARHQRARTVGEALAPIAA